MTKSRNVNRPKHRWTSQQLEIVRKLYPDTSTKEIAARLNVSLELVYRAAKRMGVEKSEEYLASPEACRLRRGDEVGKAHRFDKGHVPANKGLRRPGWSPGRMAQTQFKKGRPAHESRNYVPIGTEKIDPKRKALMRKVTDDPTIFPVKRWRPVHVLVWESVHGAIPPRHIVIFRPGMKTFEANEITVDRLELVTYEENMRRNTLYRYPKEIVSAIKTLGHMRRRIRTREKRNEEQDGGSAKSPVRSARRARRHEKPDADRPREGDR